MSERATLKELEISASLPGRMLPFGGDEFLLLRETNHRLANSLAVLAAVLRRELGCAASIEARRSFERCEERIVAFGTLHRSLVIGGSRGNIALSNYMEGLCKALSEALLTPIGVQCELMLDAGEFPADRCERLGLVVTELVTNAAKHAFCGRAGEEVRIAVLQKADTLICVVSDNGTGAGVAKSGVGSQIVEQLVRALDGEMKIRSGRSGTSVVVTCRT